MAISLLSDYCKCLKNEFLCPIFSQKCIKFNLLFIFGYAVRIGHWKLSPSKNWQNFGLEKSFQLRALLSLRDIGIFSRIFCFRDLTKGLK